jgi:tetratricopeptide (TPR) repeat protein
MLIIGLVKCYLKLGKSLEATAMAKEALALLPHSARSVALAGQVMSSNPSLYLKAREYFDKSLKMDPRSLVCLYGLAHLLEIQGLVKEAIDVLNQSAALHTIDSIHIRLGNLYLLEEEYDAASQHFNSALL